MNTGLARCTLLFLVLTIWSGCESPFDLEDFRERRLAVSGYFSPSPPVPGFLVFVSPINYFDGSEGQPLLSDAEVGIYVGNQLVLSLHPDQLQGRDVFYRGDFTPIEGVPYRLIVRADGYETLQAVDWLPGKVGARWLGYDSLRLTAFPDGRVGCELSVSFEIDDPEVFPNYYHVFVEAWLSDSTGASAFVLTELQQVIADPAVRPYLLNQSVLVDGESFAGQRKLMTLQCKFEVPPHFELSHLVLDMRHVSRHYYRFHRSHIDQLTTGTNPVVEPSLLISNVSNGFGFFAGYQSTRDSLGI